MSIDKRLQALERNQTNEGVRVIIVKGGLPDPGLLVARSGEWRVTQLEGEPDEVFVDRVTKQANSDGLDSVLIGGLPD